MRQTESGERVDSGAARSRLRIVACSALLVALAFIQSPGLMVSDTKFDLAESPVAFLRRALHLWDGTASFGQLQDQSYGYLWPTGPFFVLGHVAGLPPWVTQRLWYAMVLVVAFVGAALVVRALGVRRDLPRLLAGFAYALSPALLTTVGPISSEAWPMAMTPWVLLPLIRGTQGRLAPWRAGLLGGAAVACVGGINAIATAAVLPLGVLWLVTRARDRRPWQILGWWVAFTALGTAWWAVPLVILGRYSPPFLDFIESADTTTVAGTIVDGLRGTTHWVPYIDGSWQAGNDLITIGFLALDGVVLVGLGLVGIAHRQQRERVFLLAGVLVGLLLVTMGHQGDAQGWFAGTLNTLMDGVLAPARNVHKFDPIVRLPLVIGLALLVDVALASPRHRTIRLGGRPFALTAGGGIAALVCLLLVAGAMPAWMGRMAPTNAVQATPDYWREAVTWLDRQKRGVALALPGSSFGHYLWGSPDDEPLQYLDADSWAVRGAVPLAPAGNIRMLDAVESRLAQGEPSSGLASYLSRAGVGLLVVRNDLVADGDVPDDALVVQALAGSPGLQLIKGFGPDVGGDPVVSGADGRLVADAGWRRHRSALEIYSVEPSSVPRSTSELPVVVGGPEDVLDATDAGLVGEESTILASDLAAMPAASRPPVGHTILTDGLLDREQTFGRVHDAASAVRTEGEARRTSNRAQDYELPSATAADRTTARILGVKSILASSAASDATAYGGAVPGELPFAAIDGDLTTSWESDPGLSGSQWWQVDLGTPRTLPSVRLTLGFDGPTSEQVRVRTATGVTDPITLRPGTPRTVVLPDGETSWIRVEGLAHRQMALADVTVPGVVARRQLVLPTLPSGTSTPDSILLRALQDDRTGCVQVADRVPCLASRARPSEEPAGFERVLTMPGRQIYTGRLMVKARPGDGLTSYLLKGFLAGASASTSGVPDPRASVLAALDGRPGTTWLAADEDTKPTIEVHWVGKRTIRKIVAKVGRSAPARRPTELTVTWPGGTEKVPLDSSGTGILPEPIRTSRLSLQVTKADNSAWVDSTGAWHGLPIGISRLRLDGLPPRLLALSTTTTEGACGSGPDVLVDGNVVQTRLTAAPAALYAMQEVPAELCSPITLGAGQHTITATATDALTPASLVLDDGNASAPVSQVESLDRTQAVDRTIEVSPGQVIADQGENVNPGWSAQQGNTTLRPVTLDGWRQGWITDGGAAPIRVRFGPDRAYQLGLGAGLVGLLVLAALTIWRPRRRTATEVEAAAVPWWVVAPVGLAALGALAGWIGLAAAVVAGALVLGVRRWTGDGFGWGLMLVLLLASGFAYDLRPWTASTGWAGFLGWPQWAAVASLGVVVALLAAPTRMKGRSTRR